MGEPELTWQDAVARLAEERTRATGCAAAVKRHGGASDLAAAERHYTAAKAEIDAVIGGLIAALAQGETPSGLSDVDTRLDRAVRERGALCQQAQALAEAADGRRGGERWLLELGVAVLGSTVLAQLIDAFVTLRTAARDADALRRATIQTQLEAATWPAFSDIAPS